MSHQLKTGRRIDHVIITSTSCAQHGHGLRHIAATSSLPLLRNRHQPLVVDEGEDQTDGHDHLHDGKGHVQPVDVIDKGDKEGATDSSQRPTGCEVSHPSALRPGTENFAVDGLRQSDAVGVKDKDQEVTNEELIKVELRLGLAPFKLAAILLRLITTRNVVGQRSRSGVDGVHHGAGREDQAVCVVGLDVVDLAIANGKHQDPGQHQGDDTKEDE